MKQPKTIEEFQALPRLLGLFDEVEKEIDGRKFKVPVMLKIEAVCYEPDTPTGMMDEHGRQWTLVSVDGVLHRLLS